MSSNLHDAKAAKSEHQADPGLDPEELRAEQAGDLPERDAMSIIGVGGLEVGLPPAGLLDGVLESDVPVETLPVDRKSTRLNSSHSQISYAVFCLKKKK